MSAKPRPGHDGPARQRARRLEVPRGPQQVKAWLESDPDLEEMQERFPAEWATVRAKLRELASREDDEAIAAYVQSVARAAAGTRGPGRSDASAQVSSEVRRRMLAAALRQMSLSRATGVSQGTVRFNLVNGWVAQRLLFRRGLERKPVSVPWFRLVWPLLPQRRYLMPLVTPQGIYCFYSSALIRRLVRLIDGRTCVEIAAGDGTLSRFLRAAGVPVHATDDHSWSRTIDFPEDVERLDAQAALARYRPAVVLCSWPPADNGFERYVFGTESVQTYIVIGTRHRFGSGDFAGYLAQHAFEMREEPTLSRLVLPPELDPAVYVFERRPG
ncbi:hypothetical protein [Cellulomonas endophytica]|uniref:hypothetical protein n=1 Tax=Cellulomonas endophytica TaxID=2494735 RepID=UPI00101109D6|nr:hypothetical protein [Cellulomonas endophytica]